MKRNILMAVVAGSLLAASPALAKSNKAEMAPSQFKSSTIMQVQKNLNQQGFNVGRADGKWGRKTEEALRDFQKKNNLPATGQLDKQTLADLGINMSTGRSSSSQNNKGPSSQSNSQSNMPSSSTSGGSNTSPDNGGNQQ
jgi:peptidoglycan hydrolase-like protein with peptidoglycan-binding domain